MDLGFFAADTLGVTLYQVKGRLQAKEMHQLRMGPWRAGLQVEVESDILGARELSFWMTLAKKIRLYVIIKEKENWLFVLNEAKLKLCGEETSFAVDTVKGRITEIKPAIHAVFHWTGDEWKKVEYDGRLTMGG